MKLLNPCHKCGEKLLTCPCDIEEEKQPIECETCFGAGEGDYGDDHDKCQMCSERGYR